MENLIHARFPELVFMNFNSIPLYLGYEMKRILSYVYPVTQKIQTTWNGIMEITWSNGQKILDSANANYSYGTLQRILKFGLEQINLQQTSNILVLGLGGGSVIKTLRNDFQVTQKITAVEIDEVIIQIAAQEFDIKPDDSLMIVNIDANLYVQQAHEKFDLVIVDLFIDKTVPEVFYSIDFWKNVNRLIPEKGYLIFNAAVSQPKNPQLQRVTTQLKKSFKIQEHTKVERSNTLIIGQKRATG